MAFEEIIELDDYEDGRCVTRHYSLAGAVRLVEVVVHLLPREIAVNLLQRLIVSLGGPAHFESPGDREANRLAIHGE
jgi:hypothetical protein